MVRSLGSLRIAAVVAVLLATGCTPLGEDDSGGDVLFVRGSYPREAIYLTSADGRDVRRLVKGSSPRWSPDGTRFAYVTDDDDSTGYENLWVMNPDTGRRRLVVRTDGVVALAWAPDGLRLAYTDSRRIVVVDTETGDQRVVSLGILIGRLDWSPDGSEILVGPGAGVLDVGTGAERALAPERRDIDAARWSPTGQFVSFSQIGPLPLDRRTRQFIVVTRRDGSGGKRITGGAWDTEPAWSNDGERLYFSRGKTYADSKSEIYSVDLETRTLKRLTDNNLVDRLPDARPDGRELIELPGPPEGDIVVPNLVERHVLVEDEVTRFDRLGLKLTVLPIEPDNGLLAIVREQVPEGGARVPVGTVVKLDVTDLAPLYAIERRRFNTRLWKVHGACSEITNPRESMYLDLVRNVLRRGMSRVLVLSLLGAPERSQGSVSDWTLGRRSLLPVDCMLLRVEFNQQRRVTRFHQWYR